MVKFSRAVLTGAALLFFACVAGAQQSEPVRITFAVESQPLADALNAWAQQAGLQIIWPADSKAAQLMAPRLNGAFTAESALKQLLMGSGLTYSFVDAHTVAIRSERAPTKAQSESVRDASAALVSESEREPAGTIPAISPAESRQQRTVSREDRHTSGTEGKGEVEEEVIVTGTHVRGIKHSPSPVAIYTRADIENTGLGTTEQFIRVLPQNFGGGITGLSGGSVFGGEESGLNFSAGTGVNLRGLGADSTLVLLNGKRLAASGVGNFIDISTIPLAAIDRIEVLTDGASATYGSDAVGGVVNIILRKNFDGAETRARYATVTDGARHETQLGQVLGGTWNSGSALVSYDYFDASKLDSRDRTFAAGLFDPSHLMPEERKHSALLSASQSLNERVQLTGDAIYSKRDADRVFVLGDGITVNHDDMSAEQYGASLEANVDVASDWQLTLGAVHNTSATDTRYFRSNVSAGTFDTHATVWSFDAVADGTLFAAPGGALRLAVGTHYRSESYNSRGSLNTTARKKSRDIYAGFAELFVPIVGEGNRVTAIRNLELTLAGRYENYSDFGSSSNPKAGLLWSPVAGLNVRGTFGKSFRAPLLSELDASRPNIIVLPLPDTVGATPTLYVEGNRVGLDPEKATTWTAGIDFSPESLPGFMTSLTYFDISFEDRLANPIAPAAVASALRSGSLYSPFITRNPSIDAVNAFYSNPFFRNPLGLPAAAVRAIMDNRLTNVAVRNENGLDFTTSYRWDTSVGQINAMLSGTYLLDMKDRLVPAAPYADVLNTLYFPVDFRMRDSLGWSHNGFTATAFVNYTDNYRNPTTSPPQRVGSWTTVDVDFSYRTSNRTGNELLRDLMLSLSVQNVSDRDPPFVRIAGSNQVSFDATNATPLGRFVAFQISKAW